ncbi:hypothetical protein FE257_006076 [Aspergillus nanangensis]|uniref:Uncharacterized protein n=1 Tax=Aspergillus nanangensis TaxID=2582783 RepID=A0AAD4CQ90_ASPNN|nr:hypothetical protein FE257_006076 [Aspergillus nanangensis]
MHGHFLLFPLLSLILPSTHGWGDVGHRTVAYLAEKYLDNRGIQLVDDLLSQDETPEISDAAVWADTVKRALPYSRPWHYIDAVDNPPESCGLDYQRDCNEGCIISALENMTHRVRNPFQPINEQAESLKFLIHFLGDLHQPLHVENKSRRGNDIPVTFDNRHTDTNLHSIWDTDIPHKINGLKHNLKHHDEKTAAAEWAYRLYSSGKLPPLPAEDCVDVIDPLKCLLLWAGETNAINCAFVFKNGVEWLERENLGGEYYDGAVPVVEEQIRRAAVRLAAWLNALAAVRNSAGPLVVQGDLDWGFSEL